MSPPIVHATAADLAALTPEQLRQTRFELQGAPDPEHVRRVVAALQAGYQSEAFQRLPAEERARRQAEINYWTAVLCPPPEVKFLDYSRKTTPWALYRWQEQILAPIIQRCLTERGLRILFHVGPQMGKPVWDECLVLMGDGRRLPANQVRVGDRVITHTGKAQRVNAVHVQGFQDCVEITTNSGRVTIAAVDHPFLTPQGWIEAGDLLPGHSLAIVPEPSCSGGSEWTDDDFELLGYFVGDGCVASNGEGFSANVTSNDPVQAKRFTDVAERMGFQWRSAKKPGTTALTYHFRGGVRAWLRKTGIARATSYYKTVPEWVYRGSNHQVALFLGSYFSCDGGIHGKGPDRHGNPRPDGVVEYYSVSEPLLRGVQHLLTRLGVNARLTGKRGVYKGERHNSFRLTFASQDFVSQFAQKVPIVGEKGERLRALGAYRRNFQPNYLPDQIVATDRIGLMPCRCFEVEEDHTFTVDDLVVHNSSQLSMRAPAYLLGRCPVMRVALACYNITHASSFGGVVRDLMNAPEFLEFFPDPGCRIPKKASEQEFSTAARKALRDAQPSFQAMGLLTGFVGRGIGASPTGGPSDLLIIDDPYASPDDAKSEAVNERVWRFWKEAASPRVDEHANVIVMFHRYHDSDLAGRLIEEGGWEYIRLPALKDENEDGSDPTHQPQFANVREPDGRLSPRRSMAYLNQQKASDVFVFLGQFQGTPRAAGGNLFKEEHIRRYQETEYAYVVNGETIPKNRCYLIQTGDLAATEKEEGCWTVIGTWAVTPRHQLLLLHTTRFKKTGPEVKRLIRAEYYLWRPAFVALDRTGLGLPIVQDLLAGEPDANIPGIPVRGLVMHKSKYARAEGAAGRYEAGLMFHPAKLLDATGKASDAADWVYELERELTGFPNAAADDQVDMVSTATSCVSSPSVVLPEFSPATHVSPHELPLIEKRPLLVGWGLDPVPAWCVVQEFEGQLRVLLAHTARPGTGILDEALSLADRLKREGIDDLETLHFAALRPGTSTTMHQDVGRLLAFGDGTRPALGWSLLPGEPSRELRDETLRHRFETMKRGMPALLLDPAAHELSDALSGAYAFKVQANGTLSPDPEKNAAFSLVEALGVVVCSLYASGWQQPDEEEWDEPAGTASGAGRRRR